VAIYSYIFPMAKLTILGTGTSDGLPRIACDCPVCSSKDPKDKRLRTSALVQTGNKSILIDAGIDFRQQALRLKLKSLDAVLFTHSHSDHIEGITELRPLTKFQGKRLPCYGNQITLTEIHKRFSYLFSKTQKGGGKPQVDLVEIGKELNLFGKTILTLPVKHGVLSILGYRMGSLAYITDASSIPKSTMGLLGGLDCLILNALRPEEHETHFSFSEAVQTAQEIAAVQTYFVHMTHNVSHAEFSAMLPAGMAPAFDGLEIDFDWQF